MRGELVGGLLDGTRVAVLPEMAQVEVDVDIGDAKLCLVYVLNPTRNPARSCIGRTLFEVLKEAESRGISPGEVTSPYVADALFEYRRRFLRSTPKKA